MTERRHSIAILSRTQTESECEPAGRACAPATAAAAWMVRGWMVDGWMRRCSSYATYNRSVRALFFFLHTGCVVVDSVSQRVTESRSESVGRAVGACCVAVAVWSRQLSSRCIHMAMLMTLQTTCP